MYTIKQAKEKWCPYRRLKIHETNMCIAGKCMMWRTDLSSIVFKRGEIQTKEEEVKGYCGLVRQ